MFYSPSLEGSLILLAFLGIILLIFFIMYIIGGITAKKRKKPVKCSVNPKQSPKKEYA